MTALIIVGVLFLLMGLLTSLAGTAIGLGPSLVGAACFLAICARIMQASAKPKDGPERT